MTPTPNSKLRLKVSLDGERIYWKNVAYFHLKELSDINVIELTFLYRYKASTRTRTVRYNGSLKDLTTITGGNTFIKLQDDLYINISKILMIDEELIRGAVDKTKVTILFDNSLQLIKKFTSEYWSWWRLRNL